MTVKEQLLQEIERLPEALLEQVLNFLLFVKQRFQERLQSLIAQPPSPSPSSSQPTPNVLLDIIEIGRQVPEEEWANLPADFSVNLDHYLYGAPKVEQ